MGIRVNVIKKSIFGRIKVLIKVLIKESKFLFAFFFLRLDFFELFLLALGMLLFITKKKKKTVIGSEHALPFTIFAVH